MNPQHQSNTQTALLQQSVVMNIYRATCISELFNVSQPTKYWQSPVNANWLHHVDSAWPSQVPKYKIQDCYAVESSIADAKLTRSYLAGYRSIHNNCNPVSQADGSGWKGCVWHCIDCHLSWSTTRDSSYSGRDDWQHEAIPAPGWFSVSLLSAINCLDQFISYERRLQKMG